MVLDHVEEVGPRFLAERPRRRDSEQDQCSHPLGVSRSKHRAQSGVDRSHQGRALESDVVHDRLQVIHLLFKCRRPFDGIRQTRSAPVEANQAAE